MDKLSNKQPFEAYFVQFDFAALMGAATIASATGIATDITTDTETDVTTTLLDSSQQRLGATSVYLFVRDGEADHKYKITARIWLTDGSKFELDAKMTVKEI